MIAQDTATPPTIGHQLAIFHIKSVIHQALGHEQLVLDVVTHTVALDLLRCLMIDGCRDDEAHLRMGIHIDYGTLKPAVSMRNHSTATPGGEYDPFDIDGDKTGPNGAFNACPVWQELVQWFCQTTQNNGLERRWIVVFNARKEDMNNKFNLFEVYRIDRTEFGEWVSNSECDGLNMYVAYSSGISQ
jgi:hypothetical protein